MKRAGRLSKTGSRLHQRIFHEVFTIHERIRRNQASAVEVCRAYVMAQQLYAQRDRDGDGVPPYAQKIISTAGKHDGVYWPEANLTDDASPLSRLIDKAREQGYAAPQPGEETVYLGYAYRVLSSQGANAPGGARNYIVDGQMNGGFALLCWPAKWGDSGMLTFVVKQTGQVSQKDLGAQTAGLVKEITAYNPDSSWSAANF